MDKVTRVKYKLEGNVYRTTKKFLGNDGVLLMVTIDPTTNLTQLIKVGDTEELVEAVTLESFTEAKKVAKELLVKYGVSFFQEVRNKKEEVTNE